jgi:DNA-binding transcriptional regulator YiaG
VTDDPDLVGLHEITLMRDPPITRQHAFWLMRQKAAPAPRKRLRRLRAWDRSEAEEYVAAHFARVEAGEWFDPGRPRGRDGRWAKEPPPEPDAEALELTAWISSGRAREIRRAAGLTCLAVAGEVGVSESTVGRWENGQKFPGPAHAAAYHALLTRLAEGQGS